MGGNKNDDQNDSWPWNDKTFQDLKTELDRSVQELTSEARRIEQDFNKDGGSSRLSSFKRFVDSSFNILTDSWKRLPDNIVEIRQRMQQEQQRMLEEEQDISKRWTGSDDSPDHIAMELARSSEQEKGDARNATALLLSEALRRNVDVPVEKIEALYRDPEDMLGQLDRLAEPFFGMRLDRASRQPWLSVDWFKRNAYSPIRLEAHPDLEANGQKWRAAFEDLLDATLDKPMTSEERFGVREPHGHVQSTHFGPGLEWMLSLQCRGILPPLLPRFYRSASEHSTRALSPESLSNIIKQTRSDMPWSKRLSPFDVSLLRKDVSDLLTEVATKSTAEVEEDAYLLGRPLRSLANTEFDSTHEGQQTYQESRGDTDKSLPGNQHQLILLQRPNEDETEKTTEEHYDKPYGNAPVPQSEKDLYDWLHVFPGAQEEVVKAATARQVALRGDKDEDWEHADFVLWEALHSKDTKSVSRILNEWHHKYGDIGDLIHEPLDEFMRRHAFETHSEWFSTLNEAIRRSEIPEEDFWKQNARSKETAMLEKLDTAPLKEKWRRRQLMRRGDELVGYTLTWPLCSTEELEKMVQKMEEENDNLEEMVGEKQQQKPAAQSVAAPEKPQILSALTTTQTTRLPDGTVTTKVVLKRRFADGKEETEESMHTTQEPVTQQQPMKDEMPKQKGWFWS